MPSVHEAELFEIAQGTAARDQFPIHRRIEAVVLVAEAAERAHQRQIVDHIDHLAIDRGRPVGKIVMQGSAGGGHAEHCHHHGSRDQDQHG